ncbi:MAG TPA: hypothetical protein VH370_19740 [Humisphaera sp.]|nr:hypothetical protein [Humisphaera sp.]
MLKFSCSHCGGRLALQERHLGRLVHCPDCGGVTHPMAGEILARQKPAAKNECDNCGQSLGKLQKARRWGASMVCGNCYRALAEDDVERELPAIGQAIPVKASVVTVGKPRASRTMRAALQLPGPTNQFVGSAPRAPLDWQSIARPVGTSILLGAAAIVVVTYIIRAIGGLLLWSAAAILFLLFILAVARLFIAIRRKMTSIPHNSPAAHFHAGRSMFKKWLRVFGARHASRAA